MLYGKKTLILEEVTSTHLSNEIKKRSNQEEHVGSSLVITGKKERGEGKKVQAYQRCVTFVTGNVIRRMTASISKSD